MKVFGLATPERRAWRYAGASDTFDFVEVRQKPLRLLAEMRRGGKIVGVAEAQFNEGGDHVVSSRLDFPDAESRFTFTVDSLKPTESLMSRCYQSTTTTRLTFFLTAACPIVLNRS
jgi:hypothetical protein